MAYTSSASVKTTLGISGSGQDTIIAQLITDAETYLNRALNIIGFATSTTTETIKHKGQRYANGGFFYQPLSQFNVTAITKINGTTYAGVVNVDYQIQSGRVLAIRDLYKYYNPTYFDTFTVEYGYGYAVIPADVELLTRLLVVGLYNQKYPMGYSLTASGQPNMQGITDYSLGDESITRDGSLKTIGGIASWKNPEDRDVFNQLFMKYKKSDNVVR